MLLFDTTEDRTIYNRLIQQLEKNEEEVVGVPICGANLSSPVFDRTNFIGEDDKDIMEILDCKGLSETIDEKIIEFYKR